ncbi:NtaA/DmoA family FMN-dependent monooxygenase [Kitasatospora sp. NBC_00240]|uniref:NtaA/DmoA family FMN-dependent monooxygenase n=1 Tax=Kitasatospora sp. NBC_00240 TaxID=2903567 RepID=UPI00224FAD4A|nr:NtaA/DmoA family FMN-dependent monooxygenase [Kitasatospora sp. NBC_00240]MCX5208594.1 NtaA/DmoA family FMN-dependent monooxygenase [Kitasatospora sp. NBC_00240]
MSTGRELHLNLHMVGGAMGVHPAAWREPGSDPHGFAKVETWVEAARLAERGRMDAVFLSDTPGVFGDIDRSPHGAYYLEPTLILTAVAAATERIGLIATASTTSNEPYNIARRFKSLDVLSGGRAGWNAVTTYIPQVAANFGGSGLPPRTDRYARAEEFVDIVKGLWRSWEPDALLADAASGRFTDPRRLRPIDHRGQHFQVRGPLPLPPSAQGHPLVVQAGASEPGRELAGRTADVVFSGAKTPDVALAYADDVRARAERHGRDPRSVKILPGLMTTIADSRGEALRRLERLDEVAGHAPWRGAHIEAVGTPEHVADVAEEWFASGAADGFTLMPDVFADGLQAFVELVVPILQKRGVYRSDYRGTTLREHFGVAHPYPAAAGV